MPVAVVSTSDLAFIQAHTRPVVKAQKPRLKVAKANHKAGLPVCTAAPAITGTLTVGQALTCSTGTWLNAPSYAYQWRRQNGAAIPAATAATYTLQAADSTYMIECDVTATNGAGAVVARAFGVKVP